MASLVPFCSSKVGAEKQNNVKPNVMGLRSPVSVRESIQANATISKIGSKLIEKRTQVRKFITGAAELLETFSLPCHWNGGVQICRLVSISYSILISARSCRTGHALLKRCLTLAYFTDEQFYYKYVGGGDRDLWETLNKSLDCPEFGDVNLIRASSCQVRKY